MIDPSITSSVSTGGLCSIPTQPAMLSNVAWSNRVASTNLGAENALSNQQAMGKVGLSAVASATNKVSDLSPGSARSAVDVLTNNEVAQAIADLKAAVQAFSDTSAPPPSPEPIEPPSGGGGPVVKKR